MASPITVDIKGQYQDAEINRAIRDLNKLKGAGDSVAGKFQTVGGKIQDFGRSVSKFGGTLTKSVTLPIVGLGAAAVKGFADFDAALTQSTAIMGNVSEEVRDRMSAAARSVATNLGISHAEAAESFFFLASAGMNAEQSIAALPQVAAFAKAGMFDMSRATDLATDAQSALGMTSDNAGENLKNLTRVTDVFVKANTLANATVEQFSEAITAKAGVALRNAGKDIEEGTAVLSVFADQGVKGAQAGTTLARTLEGLQDNARKNSKEFDALNIQVYDAQGNMRPMVDIVRDMENAFAGMTVEEKNAAIAKLGFNKLAKQGILALVGNSDALANYEDGLRNAGGTVDEVAQKQLATFSEQMKLLKAQFMDIAIDIGPILINDVLKPLAEVLKQGIARFKELSPETREMIVRFALIAAAVGPVLLIVGKLITIFGGLIIGIGKVILIVGKIVAAIKIAIGVVGALAAGVKILGAVLLAATGPIGLIVIAIGAIIAALVALYHNNETVRNFIDAAWQSIQQIFQTVIGVIVEVVTTAWEYIRAATETFLNFVRTLFETVWDVITLLFQATPIGILITHWETLKEMTLAAFNVIVGIVTSFKESAVAAFTFVKNTVSTVFNTIYNTITTLLSRARDFSRTAFSVISSIITGFKDGAVAAFNVVKTAVTTVFNSIYTTIANIFNRVKDVVRGAINFIISGWNRLSFSVPSVQVGPLTFGGQTIGVPQIPMLAQGGLVVGPTLALIGEAGPEMVLPLTGRSAERAGVASTTINVTVNAGIGTDGAEVGRVIVDAIKQYERRNGSVYVAA